MNEAAERIKSAYSISRVLEDHGIKVHGNKALCPGHDDTNPSLSIFENDSACNCQVCDFGGDVITLIKKVENKTWAEIVRDYDPNPEQNGNGRRIMASWDYHDIGGNLLYQKVRYPDDSDGKKNMAWRQQTKEGEWRNNRKGKPLVPYRLPELIRSNYVFIPEGEKCALSVTELGLCATTALDGAGKWPEELTPYFNGKAIIILTDNDEPGFNHGKLVAWKLRDVAKNIKKINLMPNLPKGDVTDWIESGGTGKQLLELAQRTPTLKLNEIKKPDPPQLLKPAPKTDRGNENRPNKGEEKKPSVLLPKYYISISQTSNSLGKLYKDSNEIFLRGRIVHLLDEESNLKVVKPDHARSEFEKVAQLRRLKISKTGGFEEFPDNCSKSDSAAILSCREFTTRLREIKAITNFPVLAEKADGTLHIITGYDAELMILSKGESLPYLSLPDAVNLITQMLSDFRFKEPSDMSRAIAGIITPGMVLGRVLKERSPMHVYEANESQTGKGFLAELVASIYNERSRTVVQKKGGVGSSEETFAELLIQGHPFICFQNVRGRFDSPAIESFLTDPNFPARGPFHCNVSIDPDKFILMFTSNGVEFPSPDMPNRCNFIRLLKNDETYQFKEFSEGSILDHVRANQPLYLAAVYAVIREWSSQGKPKTDEFRHDRKRWARPLDWIVQKIFGCAPLMDGHENIQKRSANKHLSWLRDVAIAADKNERLDFEFPANEIASLCHESDIEIPGLRKDECYESISDDRRQRIWPAIGKRLKSIFGDSDEIVIDNLTVRREQKEEIRHGKMRTIKLHIFTKNSPNDDFPPIVPRSSPDRHVPDLASNPPIAPDAPDVSIHFIEPTQKHEGLRGVNGGNSGVHIGGSINICTEPSGASGESGEISLSPDKTLPKIDRGGSHEMGNDEIYDPEELAREVTG